MNFEINPIKSVSSNCDINTINNDCYGICYSFGDVYGSDMKKKCESQCRDILTIKKHSMGRTECNLRRPTPPVMWNQIPAYYPRLLYSTGDPEKAYTMCCSMCGKSRLPNSCKEKCRLDADSIVQNKETYGRC
jgi:hypothetical protein